MNAGTRVAQRIRVTKSSDLTLYNLWTIGGTIIVLLLAWWFLLPLLHHHTLPAMAAQNALIEKY